jgi:hypothetical protein
MTKKPTITDAEYRRGLKILAARPENQSGADKTWVLHLMRRLEHLFNNARHASRPKRRSLR